MKRFVFGLLSVILLSMVIGCQVDAQKGELKDIKGHWAESAIKAGVSKGYVSGFPDGTFKPDDTVTNAQFIKMIVSALEIETGKETKKWYQTYFNAAKEELILHDTDFKEEDFNVGITREQLSWVTARASDDSIRTVESSGITKEDRLDFSPANENGNKITRTEKEMRNYYQGFLTHTAFKKGILTGFGGNNIGLKDTTTRAQAVVVIERVLKLKDGSVLSFDKYATAEAELNWLKTNAFTIAPHIFDDKDGESAKDNYKIENLILKNKVFHAEVKRIILINLADEKDPYRNLLPKDSDMGFRRSSNLGKVPKDSYAIYVEYETYKNNVKTEITGVVDLLVSGYDVPNPYPQDKLVEPTPMFTNNEKFKHITAFGPEGGTGKGVRTWLIPNTGFKLKDNSVNKPNAKIVTISLYLNPVKGNNNITSHVFKFSTTHHGK